MFSDFSAYQATLFNEPAPYSRLYTYGSLLLLLPSESLQSEQTRSSSSENLPFSISRLLSKPFETSHHHHHHNNNNTQHSSSSPGSSHNNNHGEKGEEKELLQQEDQDLAAYKLATSIANSTYGSAAALYSYPHLYPSAAAAAAGHVLRVPPQRTPLTWALPPLHHAALAHQAVKDRLAGKLRRKESEGSDVRVGGPMSRWPMFAAISRSPNDRPAVAIATVPQIRAIREVF